MVAGAFGLFYATSLSGRVWCGFACPQTVWTDIFGGIGRLAHRLARGHQARVRPITLALSAIVAVATGIGFTAWFVDAPSLAGRLLSGDLPGLLMAPFWSSPASPMFWAPTPRNGCACTCAPGRASSRPCSTATAWW
ncbi:4Fe-4S binding protein [Tistrella bauzanensis]